MSDYTGMSNHALWQHIRATQERLTRSQNTTVYHGYAEEFARTQETLQGELTAAKAELARRGGC